MKRAIPVRLKPAIAVITFNQIPATNYTFKYDRLGRMAIENRRQYCKRHGYEFIEDVSVSNDRPATWAKIPAILKAFECHRWVLWADSDALIFNRSRRLEDFCDSDYDIVVQSHDEYFRHRGMSASDGLKKMPINAGVYLVQASEWAKEYLKRSYDQEQFVSHEKIWDGIGDQEAMTWVLRQNLGDQKRIKYVEHLQGYPQFYHPEDLFIHFYGNHACHRIPWAESEAVLQRWEDANARGKAYPSDLARFHWCCIQNKEAPSPIQRGDVKDYMYDPDEIMGL